MVIVEYIEVFRSNCGDLRRLHNGDHVAQHVDITTCEQPVQGFLCQLADLGFTQLHSENSHAFGGQSRNEFVERQWLEFVEVIFAELLQLLVG